MFSPSLLYSIFPLLLTPYLTTTYISPEPHPIFLASLLSISTDPYPIFPPSLLYISPNFILYFLHPDYIFPRSLPYISPFLLYVSSNLYLIFPPIVTLCLTHPYSIFRWLGTVGTVGSEALYRQTLLSTFSRICFLYMFYTKQISTGTCHVIPFPTTIRHIK